jgi:hypothetical protein
MYKLLLMALLIAMHGLYLSNAYAANVPVRQDAVNQHALSHNTKIMPAKHKHESHKLQKQRKGDKEKSIEHH